jgi:hypothetical protein
MLFHAVPAKDRAEPEDDAREGTQVLLADTSQRLGRKQTPRPRIKAPQLCDTKELDRTTHAPNRTPRPPFSQPSRPRGDSLASQLQRCETRGLLFLIAAHAVLRSTWRQCSIARYALQEFSGSAWFRMITRRPLHCHSPHPCSLIWVADAGPDLFRLLRIFRRALWLRLLYQQSRACWRM